MYSHMCVIFSCKFLIYADYNLFKFPAIILLFHGVRDMQIVVALILSEMNPCAMTLG